MGGCGSGRKWGQPVVDDARILDVDRFTQEGVLRPHVHCSGSWGWTDVATGEKTASINYELKTDAQAGWIRLKYTITNHSSGEPFPVDSRVELVTTRPHFGGVRWWFVCPFSGRRVRKLYLHPVSEYFGSREAFGLTYQSCRETAGDRATRKVQKILYHRLGGTGDVGELHRIQKPKGMHWQTYWKLRMAAVEAYERSVGSWIVQASRLLGRLPEDERDSRNPD
jgi:hypothetical protein